MRINFYFSDMELLRSVFISAENLTVLKIKNIATDRILRVINSCCSKLTILDVSQSPGVTDTGVCNLMYFPLEVSLESLKYSPLRLFRIERLK